MDGNTSSTPRARCKASRLLYDNGGLHVFDFDFLEVRSYPDGFPDADFAGDSPDLRWNPVTNDGYWTIRNRLLAAGQNTAVHGAWSGVLRLFKGPASEKLFARLRRAARNDIFQVNRHFFRECDFPLERRRRFPRRRL